MGDRVDVESYGDNVRVAVLGPLEVTNAAGPVRVGGPKERALVAALAMRAPAVVAAETLAADLWGERPPRSAPKTLQTYVSHVRRGAPGLDLRTVAPGYRLALDADAVDARRFERLVVEARAARRAGDHLVAVTALDDALDLWRGEPLPELADVAAAVAEAARLRELHLTATEDRAEALLQLGRGADLAGEVRALVDAEPLRERRWALLVRALHQGGRQAEALRAYQAARELLVEEVGVEPGAELRAAEAAVLAGESPPLAAPGTAVASVAAVTRTLLLTDVEGSTSHWERDADATAAALELLEERILAAVAAAGGEVLKPRGEGDSSFCAFARATDAMTAAVELQRSLGAASWPTAEPLRVRIAVHTGEVQARGGDLYGRSVNRAARLRGAVTGGTVVVSDATRALAADDLPPGVELVDLGTHQLPDLLRPERMWGVAVPGCPPPRLRRATGGGGPAAVPAPLTRRAGPFVGRDDALAAATAAWERAAGGAGEILLVDGEPGIGKTRLAAELAAVAVERDAARVLHGACVDGLTAAHQPLVQALSTALATVDLAALASQLEHYGGELARLVPELTGRVPGLPPPARLDAEAERLRQFDAVAAAFAGVASQRPVLLVVDDLHWASPSSLLLLRHLAGTVATVPLLLLGTYRTDEVARGSPLASFLADLSPRDGVTRISLRGIDRDAAGLLVDALGGPAGVDAGHLHEQTSGNPFFLAELIRHLAAGGDTSAVLPASVAEALGHRFDRLAPDAARLLELAAVLGERLDPDVLEAASRQGEAWVDALDACIDAGLLLDADAELAFPHALVRRAALARLSGPRRAQLHARAAAAIEERHAGDLAPHLATIAGHWGAAGAANAARAARAGARAATVANGSLAFEQAQDLAAGGLAALARATARPPDADDLEAELHLAVATAAAGLGDVPAMRQAALAAVACGRRLEDPAARARVLGRAMVLVTTNSVIGAGLQADEQAIIEEALAGVDPSDLILRSRLLTDHAYHRCIGEGWAGVEAAFDEAIAVARRSGDPDAMLWALGRGSTAFVGNGRIAELRARAAELVDVDPVLAERVRLIVALTDGDRVALDEAIARLRAFGEQYRSWWEVVQARSLDAVLALAGGQFEAADAAVADVLAAGGRDPNWLTGSMAQTVQLRYERDDVAGAVDLLDVIVGALPGAGAVLALRIQVAAEAALDRPGTGAADLNALAADDLAALRRDNMWPGGLAALVAGGALLDAPGVVAATAPHLEPFAGQMVLISFGTLVHGAADRYRGIARSMAGDHTGAEACFAAAVALESGLGADLLVARSEVWWAWARLRAGDTSAVPDLARATGAAERRGFARVAALGRRFLDQASTALRPPGATVDA